MSAIFIKINQRFLNLSAVKAVKIYEEGSIRIFSDVPNAETPGTFYYYDVDEPQAALKVLAALEKLAVSGE